MSFRNDDEPSWKKRLFKRSEQPKEELEKEIEKEVESWNGLVTEQASAVLVARRLGIELTDNNQSQSLDIENLVPDMRNVEITGHITEIQSEHNPDNKDFRVTSVIIEDDTGQTQVSFWNEDSDQAQKLKPGLKIYIENGYTNKENKVSDYVMNKYGVPGIQLGDSTEVTVYNNDGEEKTLIE